MPEDYFEITQTFSYCKECDADKPIADIPEDEFCGHNVDTHARGRALVLVPKDAFDALLALYRGTCEEAMDMLSDASGAAAMFDPDYGLISAGLTKQVNLGENPCSEFV